ncbi:hypothetical protein AYI69_g623 [Smittium culicis]|uniref:AB hydrolase-1 domain-containing protein n=1 Tax=Smittium culicis TaxID=133412 RepID=A0A1R1Y2E8_9FUNG|nr:hypothetical protein AYI69_g5986 [Smittium culicis]OMJ29844.1 hypothetical protein AYI69_g623 [Smittium culicis]
MSEFRTFSTWRKYVERLLRFNHDTMSISSGRSSVSNLKGPSKLFDQIRANQLEHFNYKSSMTIQYSFKSSSFFPSDFLSPQPQFHSQVDLSVRNFPCILFLHGSNPGGFDASRWMAAGLAQAQNVFDPMSRYSALNLSDFYSVNSHKTHHSNSLHNTNKASQTIDAPESSNDYNYFDMFEPGIYNNSGDFSSESGSYSNSVPLGFLNISRPGYLESTLTVEDTFYAESLAIIRLLDNLSIRSVRIVAHSTAALLALEMASMPQFRDRVRSVAMIDPVLSFSDFDLKKMKWNSDIIPSFIKNRYLYYSHLRNGPESSQFTEFIRKICGGLAVNEMNSDLALKNLYKNVGVLFSSNELRNSGIESDMIKMYKFKLNEPETRQHWKLTNAPICCISTSSSQDEYNSLAFNESSTILEEQRKSALLNVQSKDIEYNRIYGGGSLLYPLGEVSNVVLQFLRKHG